MAVLTQPKPMTATRPSTAGNKPGRSILPDLALTALAPMTWGTTYVITATLLPPDRPLLAATMRALPAGLLLLAFTRKLPQGIWWKRSFILAMLNFGAFFPLLFFAAYRLPGGVAATIGAVQPLIVAGFALVILKARPGTAAVAAAMTGAAGVGLLTLSSDAKLDPLGVIAMLAATTLMSLAVVIGKKWGRPEGTTLLTFTGWQLAMGGAVLAPLTLLTEGVPSTLTTENLMGYTLIGTIGTAVAYALWFRGIEKLPATSVSLLGLTNPLVAATAGYLILSQTLNTPQLIGFAIALAALIAGQRAQAKSA